MKKILLNDGLNVPAVAIGCMRFSELELSQVSILMHRAIELGGVHFDLADIYGDGRSEELVGEVLRTNKSICRDKLIIQTKCGIKKNPYQFDLSAEYISKSIDGSLQRLGCDYIDIFTLHRPDVLTPWSEVAEALQKELKLGRIRHVAISNFTSCQALALSHYLDTPVCATQMQLSLVHAPIISACFEANLYETDVVGSAGGIWDYCEVNDVLLQAWSPLQRSNWSGSFLGNDQYRELNQKLAELAEKYHCTPATIAAAWILRLAIKTQVISGSTSLAHMEDFLRASEITLERGEWYALYALAHHRLP